MGTGPPSYNLSPKGPKMGDKVCFPLNVGNPIWPFLFCLIVMCFGIQFRAYLIFTSNHYSCASYLQFDIFRIVFGSLFPYSIFCWGEGVIIGVKESEGRRTVHSWTGNRTNRRRQRRGCSWAKILLVMFELCGAISAKTIAIPPPLLPPLALLIKPPIKMANKESLKHSLSLSLSLCVTCVSILLWNSHYHFHKGMMLRL